jgi:hypothetical protein
MRTRYSKQIEGSKFNYNWPVRFDSTKETIGIDQFDETGKVKDRILLTREQVTEFIAFVSKKNVERIHRELNKQTASLLAQSKIEKNSMG